MSALLRGKDVSGMPVVDLSTGEDIAEIRDLIFDPGRGGDRRVHAGQARDLRSATEAGAAGGERSGPSGRTP